MNRVAVLVMEGERTRDAARATAGNDDRPGSRGKTPGWRTQSGRAVPGFPPAHPRSRSGATLGVNRKPLYPYYPLPMILRQGDKVMKKKFLTGIFLGCLVFLPPAAMAQNDPDPALVTKAEQGDAAAQKKLGEFYFGRKDNQNGLKWLKKAADGGSADAQNSLGFRYQNGNGVDKDVDEARNWYRKSADQGFKYAMNNLCTSYTAPMDIFKGNNGDVPAPLIPSSKEDMKEAFNWCSKGAEQGFTDSQSKLGMLYARGSADVTPDFEAAYFWFNVRKSTWLLNEKSGEQLTPEKRAEVKQKVRAWKPGMTSPYPAAKDETPPASPPATPPAETPPPSPPGP